MDTAPGAAKELAGEGFPTGSLLRVMFQNGNGASESVAHQGDAVAGNLISREAKGRVALIGYYGWRELAAQVMPDYAHLLELRVIGVPFDEAMRMAQRMARDREVDVFMSTNLMVEELRTHVGAPVVPIKITGFEILRALEQAQPLAQRVALFSYGRVHADVERAKPLFRVDVKQCVYLFPTDAEESMRRLADEGISVVIGSGMIIDLALRLGLHGIFVHGEPSIRKALDDAVEIVRLMRGDAAKHDRLNAIVGHLKEGVIAVDMGGRVQMINPAMEQLLGIDGSHISGRPLADIAPDLKLESTLKHGAGELDHIQQVDGRTLVVSRIPIREQGVQTGAVLTAQDAVSVQRADRSIRAQSRQRQFKARYRLDQIVGRSKPMMLARATAEHYARSESTVLITGESGTGKELFAQGIHNASRRRHEAFVAVNCPAIAETLLESELFGYEDGAFTGARRGGKTGLFEAAHRGTIFLDEIGDMPIALQTRLLRVLQEREILRVGGHTPVPVDVRVIAATNRDLRQQIEDRSFRQDLYYRLNILHLELPPLRRRREDLPELAQAMLGGLLERAACSLTADEVLGPLMPLLRDHEWPGNVRELENVLERVVAFAGASEGMSDDQTLRAIVPELFEGEDDQAPGEPAALRALSRANESAVAREVLADCGGDHAMAARRLGISRTTLWRKLQATGSAHSNGRAKDR